MLAAVALRSVLAVSLAAAPAQAVPATPAPVQRPTQTPVETPSAAVTPAPAAAPAGDNRGYVGIEASIGVAPASPPVHHEVAPSPVPEVAPPNVLQPVMDASPAVEPEGPIDESEPAYDPLVDSPEAKKARNWLAGGIVFTVVGGVLGIGGIAMATAKVNVPGESAMPCDPRGDAAGNGCTPGGRDRSAATLGIPGLLLLAGGVAMIVVGKRQQARLRASLQADRRGLMIGASLRF